MTEETSSAALKDLLSSATSLQLSDISGETLKINSNTYNCNTPITFSVSDDKTLTYSLISLFLQLQNPSIGVVEYKKICNKYGVSDFVKVTEKKRVLNYFLSGDSTGDSKKVRIDEGRSEDGTGVDKLDGDKDKGRYKDHNRSKSKRGRDDSNDASTPRKKEKKEEASTPITHHQLLEDLNIVVDKRAGGNVTSGTGVSGAVMQSEGDDKETTERDGDVDTNATPTEEPPQLLSHEEEERRSIQACLSAIGYEATKLSQEILEQDRVEVEKITNFEIPVGDSGSILRCGAMSSNLTSQFVSNHGRKSSSGVSEENKRNFARVLDLFEEARKEEQQILRHGSSSKHKSTPNKTKSQQMVKPSGNPIIVVPNAMTSPITLVNSQLFFGKSNFIPREKCQKSKETKIEITRTVSSRHGGGSITYEIIDNPNKLLKNPSDWARVVAVVAQGESWQFKGWKMGWVDSNKKGFDSPVQVFSHSFGFYVGFEGAPIPNELAGWNVKTGFLSRDKRGLDSVVFAQFWNGLDEWMHVHKRELLAK